MASEMYSLAWKEFQTSACSTFNDLFGDQNFADVTLACDDGKQIKAHKVILASSSLFFKTILLQNPHQHPLLYLKGIKLRELESIARFIYFGEVEVDHSSLEDFMAAAKDLQIKGLIENTSQLKQLQLCMNILKMTKCTSKMKFKINIMNLKNSIPLPIKQ